MVSAFLLFMGSNSHLFLAQIMGPLKNNGQGSSKYTCACEILLFVCCRANVSAQTRKHSLHLMGLKYIHVTLFSKKQGDVPDRFSRMKSIHQVYLQMHKRILAIC